MPYTVGLPGGTRDYEFEAYVRLLEKSGVNVSNTSRVLDPVTKQKWLYAWQEEADANKFTEEIRKTTENPHWTVYSLPEDALTQGPLGPIEILVSTRSDGSTYSLSPTSRKLVLKKFPGANLAPNVFISKSMQSDFEAAHGRIWDQVAIILTGLSDKQIQELGGYRVIDPIAQRVFRDAPALSA